MGERNIWGLKLCSRGLGWGWGGRQLQKLRALSLSLRLPVLGLAWGLGPGPVIVAMATDSEEAPPRLLSKPVRAAMYLSQHSSDSETLER